MIKLFLVILTTGLVISLFGILYSNGGLSKKIVLYSPVQSDTSLPLLVANATTAYDHVEERNQLPARLKIPSIGVDAVIEYAGLTPTGAMDVPKDRYNVAWFYPGTLPGESGSAVIAGHSGYKTDTVAFDNLNKLHKGDILYVEDTLGKSISFMVRESRLYDRESYTPEIFVSDNGKHLNLVTCSGAWDKSKQDYDKRLVVFADIVQ